MFGISSQKPAKLKKFVSSNDEMRGGNHLNKSNRISQRDMRPSQVSNTPDPSNINLDLTGDIYETFGYQNRQESQNLNIKQIEKNVPSHSDNKNSSHPTSRARSFLESKNASMPKDQDNSVPAEFF